MLQHRFAATNFTALTLLIRPTIFTQTKRLKRPSSKQPLAAVDVMQAVSFLGTTVFSLTILTEVAESRVAIHQNHWHLSSPETGPAFAQVALVLSASELQVALTR